MLVILDLFFLFSFREITICIHRFLKIFSFLFDVLSVPSLHGIKVSLICISLSTFDYMTTYSICKRGLQAQRLLLLLSFMGIYSFSPIVQLSGTNCTVLFNSYSLMNRTCSSCFPPKHSKTPLCTPCSSPSSNADKSGNELLNTTWQRNKE